MLNEPFVCLHAGSAIGIGMVPRSAVAEGLSIVEITDDWAPRDLQLCICSRACVAPAVRALEVVDRGRRHPAAIDAAGQHLPDILANFGIDQPVQFGIHRN